MGGSRSSSKRKSSKRKSSKISSEARWKKRSRRNKSKKLSHRKNSYSYSDDDSKSSISISSSSSEDECSRARSCTRSKVKGTKKRTRGISSSHGSSDDSLYVKKRKRSNRSANSDTRKKSKKKRHRRERSISSISRDSRSCSACQGGNTSSGESEFARPRGRSREKRKDERCSVKAKRGTESNKYSSRSSYSSYSGKDIQPVETNSRRLRSIITVAKSPGGEEKGWDKDHRKEEIVYDHDDYPCRSNDSNDESSKREQPHHSDVDLEMMEENAQVTLVSESAKGESALVSDFKMTKLTRIGEHGAQDCRSISHFDGVGANNSIKEDKVDVFPALSNSNGDDLESLLRLKALENLRKYRGGLQTNAETCGDDKNRSGSDVKQVVTAKVESVQNRSPKDDGSRVVSATRVLDENPGPTMGGDSCLPASSYGKVKEGKGSVDESGSVRRRIACPPTQVAISSHLEEGKPTLTLAGVVTSKSELDKSALTPQTSVTALKQAQKANMLVAECDVNESSAEISKSVGQKNNDNNNGIGVNNVCESSTSEPSTLIKPSLEVHDSKEQHGKGNEGSQFEQKTMSVMRGGEMVQVSYKVYIPKKAPALARRQLRR